MLQCTQGGDVMNKRFPFSKRYWIYLMFSILLIGNIYRTDSLTGDKSFSEFVRQDWKLFFIFLLEEIIIAGAMFLFAYLCCRISKNRNKEIVVQRSKDKYSGIDSGDYDYVWFDFENIKRALILKKGDNFRLYVQECDDHTGNWESVNGVSFYESLEAVKKVLFYEFDFYCNENADLDKHGDEIYKETE